MAIGKLRYFTKQNCKKGILKAIGRCEIFDIVLSEMNPNASGIKSLDQDRVIDLAMKVGNLTLDHGHFGTCPVLKVWQTCSVLTIFTDLLKEDFKDVQHFKPDAPRKDRAEIYIVACSLIRSPVWQFESCYDITTLQKLSDFMLSHRRFGSCLVLKFTLLLEV